MCLCICVTCMCVWAGDRHIYVFGGQGLNSLVFLNCFLLKYFETGSLTESRTHQSSYMSWPMSFRDLPPPYQLGGCSYVLSCLAFHMCTGILKSGTSSRLYTVLSFQPRHLSFWFTYLILEKNTNMIPIFKSPTYFITSILALFLIQQVSCDLYVMLCRFLHTSWHFFKQLITWRKIHKINLEGFFQYYLLLAMLFFNFSFSFKNIS